MDAHEFVIVGAGLAGAATAFHLAQRGVRDIVLLEREAVPGVHASGRNAALIRESTELDSWRDLNRRGAEAVRSGEFAPFRRSGSVLIGLGDEAVEAHFPLARGRGLWCPNDGVVDVAALLATYLEGRDVRYGTSLSGYSTDGDALRVETTREPFRARTLVNAAGAWAGVVGDLPLRPTNRHLFVTEPMPRIDPAWPFVWDLDGGLYFRPESGGLLLCACDETDAAPGAYVEEPAVLETLAERVTRLQPDLGDLRISYRWVGQRTFATDRAPVVGFDPREPRLFHVAGLGGHGVTASHALGALAADLLLGATKRATVTDPGRLLVRT
ncbi:MAG: NAD(P)/FAD-dependent oxidoreductase [Planctomycetota bacterium]